MKTKEYLARGKTPYMRMLYAKNGYLEDKQAQARYLVGKRVEIPVHYNAWARGARYGDVTRVGKGGDFVYVKLDKISKPIKVWRLDYDYIKVI